MKNLKLIAFDTFGTVFDLSQVPRTDLKAYNEHIHKPDWSPISFPQHWNDLVAHPDAAEGIERLREEYTVVTLSNGPLGFLTRLSKKRGITWDAITPLEMFKVFKPHPYAYLALIDVYGYQPNEIMMCTANEHFGDLEGSKALGMTPMLIKRDNFNNGIITLAKLLGC